MDFSEYTVWLLKTALAYWIVFAIIMPFFLAGELIYMTSKKKMTKKENGEWQQINNIAIGMLVVFFVINIVDTFPIIKDAVGQNYVCVKGEYSIEHARQSKGGGATEWVVITTDDGARIALDYPRGKDLSELPDDTCYGTVWYSENSHYILEFIPDEPTDGN